MDTGTLKGLELLLIVGVVGYFYLRQRSNLQRLKEEREAKQREESGREQATQGDSSAGADATGGRSD
jgi:hypothetical protein